MLLLRLHRIDGMVEGWWRGDGEASMDETVVVGLHHLILVLMASSLFSAHLPAVSFLHVPPLCLTPSCWRASICLQSFSPSPPTPFSSSPSSQISPISLPFPQLLPRPLPVWLEPWLVQLSITGAEPCQGQVNPEALLSPQHLSLLSASASFLLQICSS